MNKKLLIIPIVIAILFCLLLTVNVILYKTWGNNEHHYLPINGLEVECDINLLQKPSNCRPIPDYVSPTCTDEMITHMEKHSNIFSNDTDVYLDWIGFGDPEENEQFEKCWDDTLANRTVDDE